MLCCDVPSTTISSTNAEVAVFQQSASGSQVSYSKVPPEERAETGKQTAEYGVLATLHQSIPKVTRKALCTLEISFTLLSVDIREEKRERHNSEDKARTGGT